MKSNSNIQRTLLKLKWIPVFMLLSACVDRLYFNVPTVAYQTVVEGMISDSAGPYTVQVSKNIQLDQDSSYRDPIQQAKVKLFDDEGNAEDLTETSPGTYSTGGVIQGKVGHTYHIRIETADGKIFESEPDQMNAPGEIEQITYEFEARIVEKPYGKIRADVFNVFVDAKASSEGKNYFRWRFTGTYRVDTSPSLHTKWFQGFLILDPFPCSGFIVTGGLRGGILEQIADCSCCTCWAKEFEWAPQVSDGQYVIDNKFQHVKVSEVPVNTTSFSVMYQVQVEQMSLTKNAYDFFRLIRAQKEGATSLFQPPSGEIIGNVKPLNPNDKVVGIFWASAVRSNSTFIHRGDVPYLLPAMDFDTHPCTTYPNSSTVKPDLWP